MRRYLLPIFILGILALAGCGGSSDDPSDPTSTETAAGTQGESLSKTEYIAEADQICKKAQEDAASMESQFTQLSEGISNPKQAKELADLLGELTAHTKREVAQLKALEPPPADAEVVNSFFAAVEDRIATGEDFADAVEDGDQSRVNSLNKQGSSQRTKSTSIAQRYGFKVCGAEK